MGGLARIFAASACVAALAAPALPEDAAPPKAPSAVEILAKAAEKQGGASLCPPAGSLASFRITFQKVTAPKVTRNADGSTTRTTAELDDKGVVLVWRGDEIRTSWKMNGKTTQRGRALNKGVMTAWLNDGTSATKRLTKDENPKDIEEIDRDQRIVRAVADVALLRRRLSDGSSWSFVAKPEAPAHPGIALQRAAADASKPLLTVWIDEKTSQINAARTQEGGAALDFVFEHDPDYPRVSGAALAFPFKVHVTERVAPATTDEPVLDGSIFEVAFNGVTDDDLKPVIADATPRGGSAAPAPGK